jgi:dipeptidyl aminopeptidase/acylaminoacyl peptidase
MKLALFAAVLCIMAPAARAQQRHALTIDDVLDVQRIDQATLSPDGRWIAAVIQRPARDGEVYGRTAYEIDPTRSDVWLIDAATGKHRALTDGRASAAGYWCASWSPDGSRLALLSTQPSGAEPRGGDNVRLYVWNRRDGSVVRMGDTPVMTQSRYGGALDKLDLHGGRIDRAKAHACNPDEDGAPFLWLDDHRLLVVSLAAGQVSGLLDQYGRPFAEAARTAARLRAGSEPTGLAMGSGAARMPPDPGNQAILRVVDTASGHAETIATLPAYPFRSALSLWVSPDGKRMAVLATLGALQPEAGQTLPNNTDDSWTVERRLGMLDVTPNATIHWIEGLPAARYPLTIFGWRPDGRIAFAARASQRVSKATPFLAAADGGIVPAGTDTPPAAAERTFALPAGSAVMDDRPDLDTLVWTESSQAGLTLHLSTVSTGKIHDLLKLDAHLASVDWGERRLIPYTGLQGEALNAVAILPPGYRADRRYPVLVWVYGGYVVRRLEGEYYSDPFMPGIYNLQIYAARGYVVLVPSMPLGDRRVSANAYARIRDGVIPAIDKLAELGIADPRRLGVFGQSFGGYSVFALLTQDNPFKAGVAMAGISDFSSHYGEMDPGAVGYPGIAHEKSDNWAELEYLVGSSAPPWQDPARYAAVSPLSYVDRVTAPLLIIHGDLDNRGSPSQAERFFYGLYAQGKTAKLLRYAGESHSLAQSPANIRSIYAATADWFDTYLGTANPTP